MILSFAGDSYVGAFKNGVPHGHGLYKYKNGCQYEGQFVAGKKEGEGKETYPDGAKYDGFFSNNNRHGYDLMDFFRTTGLCKLQPFKLFVSLPTLALGEECTSMPMGLHILENSIRVKWGHVNAIRQGGKFFLKISWQTTTTHKDTMHASFSM
jgi:hypothetical protein